jgi:hypothetical protein
MRALVASGQQQPQRMISSSVDRMRALTFSACCVCLPCPVPDPARAEQVLHLRQQP